ncbi:fungal-specific transcription factor domain-containing protein [Trichoderma evansii]
MCLARGFECTYLKPQKKRGPAGKRLAQIQQDQGRLRREKNLEQRTESVIARISESAGAAGSDTASTQSLLVPGSEWPSQEFDVGLSTTDHASQSVPDIVSPIFANDLPISSLGDVDIFSQSQDTEYWPPDRATSQIPPSGFPWGGSFVDFAALPPVIDTAFQENNANPTRTRPYDLAVPQDQFRNTIPHWPGYISEASLIPWMDVYFDRLHPTMPVLNRSTLFTKIYLQEHRHNPLFGSMILALCAFAITQPIFISERPTSSSREHQAKLLMNEAMKMRSSFDFGESPTLEAVMTSFFLFGSLFGTNQHNAAWLRLREAIDLAQTMGLDDSNAYRGSLGEETGQNLRAYMVLFITERAYSIQRRHPITLKQMRHSVPSISDDLLSGSSHGLLSGMIVFNEKDAAALMGLSVLMQLFSAIQDEFIDCWNATCAATQGGCSKSNEKTVLLVYEKLKRVQDRHLYSHYDRLVLDDQLLDDTAGDELDGQTIVTQHADILVTQKWLQNRLWYLCMGHSLLKSQSPHPELQFDYAIRLAESTLALCQKLPLSFMEAHGVGLVRNYIWVSSHIISFADELYQIEKLYDISVTAIRVLSNPALPIERLPPNTTSIPQHQNEQGIETSHHNLIRRYFKMFSILRGGNHPYLGKYVAHLHSLGFDTPNLEGC